MKENKGIQDRMIEVIEGLFEFITRAKWMPLILFTLTALILYGVNNELREAVMGMFGFVGASLLLIKLFIVIK